MEIYAETPLVLPLEYIDGYRRVSVDAREEDDFGQTPPCRKPRRGVSFSKEYALGSTVENGSVLRGHR